MVDEEERKKTQTVDRYRDQEPEEKEKAKEEEDERWRKLEHAIALAVNYFQMNPVDNEYSKEIIEIIADRARKNYKRSTGREDDFTIKTNLRSLPRSNIESCILPPKLKTPSNSNTDTFISDDMFGA